MSFKGVVEFIVQVESLRNIDLFHQGFYQMRLSIYHEEGNKVKNLSIIK